MRISSDTLAISFLRGDTPRLFFLATTTGAGVVADSGTTATAPPPTTVCGCLATVSVFPASAIYTSPGPCTGLSGEGTTRNRSANAAATASTGEIYRSTTLRSGVQCTTAADSLAARFSIIADTSAIASVQSISAGCSIASSSSFWSMISAGKSSRIK